MIRVFIDGSAGTTGLRIRERLEARKDISLLTLPEAQRKDPDARRDALNTADVSFLCLPDAAAVEAVTLVDNPATRIIDASTAHRTAPGWAYGFPELSAEHREAVRNSRRVANPGCHATGFISVVYPLVAAGALSKDAALSCFSLTGYSGGGKKMIAEFEDSSRDPLLDSPALYAVGQSHKHLPEMQKVCGLSVPPVFCPIVDDYYKGMAGTVPLHASQLSGVSCPEDLRRIYQAHYSAAGGVVSVLEEGAPARIHAGALAGQDRLEIVVAGNGDRVTVTAVFDNLGKGASGAAVQNMNLMLGFIETAGLNLE